MAGWSGSLAPRAAAQPMWRRTTTTTTGRLKSNGFAGVVTSRTTEAPAVADNLAVAVFDSGTRNRPKEEQGC